MARAVIVAGVLRPLTEALVDWVGRIMYAFSDMSLSTGSKFYPCGKNFSYVLNVLKVKARLGVNVPMQFVDSNI